MAADRIAGRSARSGDFPYFRTLRNTVVVSLMAAAFLPLLILGGAVYFYTTSALRQEAMRALSVQVLDHRNLIDQFLAERTRDLGLLAAAIGFEKLSAPEGLAHAYRSLQRGLPCFADLGLIDAAGDHRAYVGPYDLMARNYRDHFWFAPAMEKGVFISDVYLGYRQVPHFIIAVREEGPQGPFMLRATVDADFFERFVSRSAGDIKIDAYMINARGIFQTRPGAAGAVMEQSPFRQTAPFEGVRFEERGGRIFAMAWQQSVPWISVVEMDRADILASLDQARWIGLLTFILGALLIVPTVLLTTNNLVRRLETKRMDLRFLDQQLQHASKMAAAGRLAQGALEDITDSLANIHAASQWLRELMKTGAPGALEPDEVPGTLDQIDAEIHRSEKAVRRGLELSRPAAGPVCIELNVGDLIAELLDHLRRDLHFKQIRVKRTEIDPAARTCSDPDGLRQVLQNLITNAVAASETGGEIAIAARAESSRLRITVTDGGPGIPPRDLERIFEPLYTTRSDGLGLGLTISRSIAAKLGGTLQARNVPAPGRGAVFTLELPV